jgi:glycosyltransferase involved in cell wall biosynthesis
MPRVSIITPTRCRQDFLPALWDCVRTQSFQDIEWLIHDGSANPLMFDALDDPRVHYNHVPGPMMIGTKRNALCRAAQGEIIAHFDDDDYYAPKYIERMLSFMTDLNVEFVKLFGFFVYRRTKLPIFAYYNLETDFPVHYLLQPGDGSLCP